MIYIDLFIGTWGFISVRVPAKEDFGSSHIAWGVIVWTEIGFLSLALVKGFIFFLSGVEFNRVVLYSKKIDGFYCLILCLCGLFLLGSCFLLLTHD